MGASLAGLALYGKGQDMNGWEYKTIIADVRVNNYYDFLWHDLISAGRDGWELVNTLRDGLIIVCFMKRGAEGDECHCGGKSCGAGSPLQKANF